MIRITAEQKRALDAFQELLKKNNVPVYEDEKKVKEETDGGKKKKKKVQMLVVDDEDFLSCVERLKADSGIPVEIRTKGKSISLILTGGDASLYDVDTEDYFHSVYPKKWLPGEEIPSEEEENEL